MMLLQMDGLGKCDNCESFGVILTDHIYSYIFWGMAYLSMHPGPKKWSSVKRSIETLINYALIVFGFYILVAGTYASLELFLVKLANLPMITGINTIYCRRLSCSISRCSVQLYQ